MRCRVSRKRRRGARGSTTSPRPPRCAPIVRTTRTARPRSRATASCIAPRRDRRCSPSRAITTTRRRRRCWCSRSIRCDSRPSCASKRPRRFPAAAPRISLRASCSRISTGRSSSPRSWVLANCGAPGASSPGRTRSMRSRGGFALKRSGAALRGAGRERAQAASSTAPSAPGVSDQRRPWYCASAGRCAIETIAARGRRSRNSS